MTWFSKHLQFIAAVTESLNSLPAGDDFYIHVELREEGSHRKVGEWSDRALAHEKRFQPATANTYTAKADGVRLALGYVNELRRFAGGDQ